MQNIEELGSISAAAKKMEMSYPRASRLVGELNAMFEAPLIDTFQGGAEKGGARLTQRGHDVLQSYLEWVNKISESSNSLRETFRPKA